MQPYTLQGFVLDPLTNHICLALLPPPNSSSSSSSSKNFFHVPRPSSLIMAVPSANCKADFSALKAGDLVHAVIRWPPQSDNMEPQCPVLDQIRLATSR